MTQREGDLHPTTMAVMDAIVEAVKTDGFPPSMRELCTLTGLAAPSTVAYHLEILERRGMIRRIRGRPRAIVVIGKPVAKGGESRG